MFPVNTRAKTHWAAKIIAPAIVADSVEVVTYQEACAPTLYTATVQTAAQTQCGFTVSVDSVELAEKETRVAVTVTNNGAAAFSIYDSSAKIVQNGKAVRAGVQLLCGLSRAAVGFDGRREHDRHHHLPALEKADF